MDPVYGAKCAFSISECISLKKHTVTWSISGVGPSLVHLGLVGEGKGTVQLARQSSERRRQQLGIPGPPSVWWTSWTSAAALRGLLAAGYCGVLRGLPPGNQAARLSAALRAATASGCRLGFASARAAVAYDARASSGHDLEGAGSPVACRAPAASSSPRCSSCRRWTASYVPPDWVSGSCAAATIRRRPARARARRAVASPRAHAPARPASAASTAPPAAETSRAPSAPAGQRSRARSASSTMCTRTRRDRVGGRSGAAQGVP